MNLPGFGPMTGLVVLVLVFAPAIQPVYALVDRLQSGRCRAHTDRLAAPGLGPGASEDQASRIRTAMLATSSMSAVLAVLAV